MLEYELNLALGGFQNVLWSILWFPPNISAMSRGEGAAAT
jgi:hypothetical protein